METTITTNDIRGIIRRRMKLIIGLFSFVMTGAVIIAVSLPPIYRSQAVILIESQQISDAYVQSTITSYAEQRLEMITRDILKYKALKKIIEEFNLYPEYIQRGDIGQAVEEMKAAVKIEPISSKVGVKSVTVAFNCSYEGKDPQKTYAVVNRLSNLYLEKETETREKQAAATTGFLESELANLRQQVEEHERKISDFKKRHIGELPESTAANLSTLQRFEREVEQANLRIRSLEDRKIYLKGQLASIEPLKPIQTDSGKLASNPQERLKTLRLELIRARARLSPKHPDIKKLTSEINQLERQVGESDTTVAGVKRLNILRAELKELRASKGDKHPDVVALTKQVNEMAKQVDAMINQNTITDFSKEKPDNPAYINLMTQIVSAELEIKNLKEDIARAKELILDYQQRVENAPIVEREYNELTMDYKSAKERYNEISGKLLKARVGQEMELQQQGEHFTITDPAYVPTRPFKPNRLAIILLGFVLASCASITGAAFREATDHTIKSSTDLINIKGVDLLSTMPYTPTKEELLNRRNKRLALTVGCLGVLAVAIVAFDLLVFPINEALSIVFTRLAF
jgi:polysaccharide biosynthesis transport protein